MPTARLHFRNHRLASLALAALFIVSMTLSLRSAWDLVDEMLHGEQYAREDFDLDTQTFKVTELGAGAERAGLRKGDIVVGVNGHPVQGWSDIYVPVRRARTGDHLLLGVKRASIEEDISVPLPQFTYVGYLPGSAAYVVTILFRILTPLFCLALGFWVAAVRVGDRAAWALLVLMLSVSNLVVDDVTSYGHEGVLQPFLTGLSIVFIRLGLWRSSTSRSSFRKGWLSIENSPGSNGL